jgi:hypothetical protein
VDRRGRLALVIARAPGVQPLDQRQQAAGQRLGRLPGLVACGGDVAGQDRRSRAVGIDRLALFFQQPSAAPPAAASAGQAPQAAAADAAPALQVPTAIAMRAAIDDWVEGRDSAIEQFLEQVFGWRLHGAELRRPAVSARPWMTWLAL